MLTLGPSLVPLSGECHLGPGLSSSFSSGGPVGRTASCGWCVFAVVLRCYGNGSSSGLPRRGRPSSFEQAATQSDDDSHTR